MDKEEGMMMEENEIGGGEGGGDIGDPVPGTSVDNNEEEENRLKLMELVLNNQVISEKISSFLGFGDMKMASEASKLLYRMIRNTQKFQEKAVLLIWKETVAMKDFLPVALTEYDWKTLEIDVTIPPELVELLIQTEILKKVNTLHLRFQRTDKMADAVLVKFLTDLLTNTQGLRVLKMEAIFVEHILHDFFSDVSVQQILCNLRELEICAGYKLNDAVRYLGAESEDDEEGPFPRNFYQMACLPMKLEVLTLGKIYSMSEPNTTPVKFIPEFIKANAPTLVDLTVHMQEVWRLEEMGAIRCPKLKRLSLTAPEVGGSTIAEFLDAQPHLEHLSVKIREKFSTVVLNAIQRRSHRLKSLHLTAKKFWDPRLVNKVPVISWNFLSQIESLRDFSIIRSFTELDPSEQSNREDWEEGNDDDINGWDAIRVSVTSRHQAEGTGVSYLKALPATTSSLQMRGIEYFWYDPEIRSTILDIDAKKHLITKFTNLTSLSFYRCEYAVDDELLQLFIRHCTHLRKLELTHGHGALTNYGITGINDETKEVTGVSLKKLTGLNELLIKACVSITIEGIKEAVALPYLRKFEYFNSMAVKKEDALQIVRQNPSLESIAMDFEELEIELERGELDLKDDLKVINRRICRVVNLDNETWGDADSLSDADEPPYFHDLRSSISGGGHEYDSDILYDDEDYYEGHYGYDSEDEFDYV